MRHKAIAGRLVCSSAIGPLVYLIQADKWFKIGYTGNFSLRMKQLGTQPPFETSILHIIQVDGPGAELFFHDKYASHRVRGEWFKLTNDDVLGLMDIDQLDDDWHPKNITTTQIGNWGAYMLGFVTAFNERPASMNPFAPETRCDRSWQWGFIDWMLTAEHFGWVDPRVYPESLWYGLSSNDYTDEAVNERTTWNPFAAGFVLTMLRFGIRVPPAVSRCEEATRCGRHVV